MNNKHLTLIILCCLLVLVASGCTEESNTSEPPNWYTILDYEYSYGEVTVLTDAVYDRRLKRIAACGYRDSLGDGNTEGLILFSPRKDDVLFIKDPGITSVSVIDYDEAQTILVALATGTTSSNTLFRIPIYDSVATSYHVAFDGDVVHPTGLVFSGGGIAVISGWIDDGNIEKGFAVSIDSEGNVRWSKYISEPGMNVRGVQIKQDNEGYTLACTFTPIVTASVLPSSKLYLLTLQGDDRNVIPMSTPGLKLIDFESESDTGYCVVGTTVDINNIKRTYFGMLNLAGNVKWEIPLVDDSLFIPVTIVDKGHSYAVYGNMVASSTTYLIGKDFPGYTLYGGPPSNNNEGKQYTAVGIDLYVGIKSFEYNNKGQLLKSVSFIRIL